MTQNALDMKHTLPIQDIAPELQSSMDDLATALDPTATSSASATTRGRPDEEGTRSRQIETIMQIPVSVKIVLGSATMPVANLLKLGRGAVVPLDRRVGEPVEVVVNGRVVARGEVVVLDDDNSRFGVSLTEVIGGPGSGKAG
jgi:flagellar motor switch protein FliN/FliY